MATSINKALIKSSRRMKMASSTDNLLAHNMKQQHELVKIHTTVGKSLEIDKRFPEYSATNLILNGVFDLKLTLTIMKQNSEKPFYKSFECLDNIKHTSKVSVSSFKTGLEELDGVVDDVIEETKTDCLLGYSQNYLVDAHVDSAEFAKFYNTKVSINPLRSVEEAFRARNWQQMFLVLAIIKHKESHSLYVCALGDAFFYTSISNMYTFLPVFRNISDFFIGEPYYIREEILHNHLWDYLNPLLAKLIPNTVSFLHICAITNHSEMLEGLLKLEIEWEDETISKQILGDEECKKLSPLHLACLANSVRCVKILLLNNVNANALCNSYWAKTPLLCAICSGGNLEIVDMLLDNGALVDFKHSPCGTALHLAVSLGLKKYIIRLLDYGAEINTVTQVDVPLVVRIAQQLSTDKNIECDMENFKRRNCTPLMLACLIGEEDIAKVLLFNKADPNLADCQNQTAIFYAISQWRTNIIDILANHKVNFNHICDDNGNTALITILLNTNNALDYEDFIPCILTLILHKADLSYTNSRGESALKLLFDTNYNQNTAKIGSELILDSCRHNLYSFIKTLTKNDVDLNIHDDDFDTPLHIACQQGYFDLIQLLLQQGADPYVMNSKDATPLQLAVERGNYDAVEQMLNSDSQFPLNKVVSSNTKSPWTIAAEAGDDRILSILVRSLEWEDKLPWKLMFKNKMNKSIQTWLMHPNYFVIAEPKINSLTIKFKELDHVCYGRVTLFQLIAEAGNEELSSHPVVLQYINSIMSKFGNFYLWLWTIYFMIFMLMLGITMVHNALETPQTAHKHKEGNIFQIVRYISEGIIVLQLLLSCSGEVSTFSRLLFGEKTTNKELIQKVVNKNELAEFVQTDDNIFRGKVKMGVCKLILTRYNHILPTLIRYFGDIESWVNFAANITLLAYLIFRVLLYNKPNLPNADHIWYVAILAFFFNSLLLLRFLRLFSVFGTYVEIILVILKNDVPKFILLFSLTLLAWSVLFILSLRIPIPYGSQYSGNKTHYINLFDLSGLTGITTDYWYLLLFGIRLLLEQADPLGIIYYYNHFNAVALIFFLSFMFIVLILYLNILIAQLSDSYVAVKGNASKVVARNRMRFIRDCKNKSIFANWFRTKKEYNVISGNEIKNLFGAESSLDIIKLQNPSYQQPVNVLIDNCFRDNKENGKQLDNTLANINTQLTNITRLLSAMSNRHDDMDQTQLELANRLLQIEQKMSSPSII